MTDWGALNTKQGSQLQVRELAAGAVGVGATRAAERILAPVGLMALFRLAVAENRHAWSALELVCSLCEQDGAGRQARVALHLAEPGVLHQMVMVTDHLRDHHGDVLAYVEGAEG